jgi:hypothetical protein
VCVFGIWVGAFTNGNAGTIGSRIPRALR